MPIIIPESQCSVVTEAYYGKTKELLEIEKLFVPIIDVISKEYSFGATSKDDLLIDGRLLQDSVQLKKIEMLFCKAIGLGDLSLTFYNAFSPMSSAYAMNAYNIPSIFIDIKQKIMPKKVSRKDLTVKVFIDKGFVHTLQMTPGELIAVILHEIGHSLDQSMFKFMTFMLPDIRDLMHIFDPTVYMPVGGTLSKNPDEKLVSYIVNTYIMGPVVQEIQRYVYPYLHKIWSSIMAHIPVVSKLHTALHSAFMALSGICGTFSITKAISEGKGGNVKNMLFSMISPMSLFGYGGEKYADSVATAYGYGVETATLHRKMQDAMSGDNAYMNASKVPLVKAMLDLASCTASIPFMLCDPHPTSSIRVYSQLKKLRRELKNPDIPKCVAKEIEAQIVELEKICTDMTDLRSNAERGTFFSAMWNNVMINVFDGMGDPREILELIWRHEE